MPGIRKTKLIAKNHHIKANNAANHIAPIDNISHCNLLYEKTTDKGMISKGN